MVINTREMADIITFGSSLEHQLINYPRQVVMYYHWQYTSEGLEYFSPNENNPITSPDADLCMKCHHLTPPRCRSPTCGPPPCGGRSLLLFLSRGMKFIGSNWIVPALKACGRIRTITCSLFCILFGFGAGWGGVDMRMVQLILLIF